MLSISLSVGATGPGASVDVATVVCSVVDVVDDVVVSSVDDVVSAVCDVSTVSSAVVSAGFSLGRLAAFITSATITIIAVNANIRKNIIHLPSACNPFSLKLLLLISNFSPDS